MTIKTPLAALAATLVLSSPVLAVPWGDLKHLDSRKESLSTEGITTIKVEAGAGYLHVVGDRGAQSVSMKADFKGKDESVLKDLELTHRRSGDTLFITAKTDSGGTIDLELEVPAGVELKLFDGSGSLEVRDVQGPVFITDGSGSMKLEGLGGKLDVVDGSGSITARALGGDVRILDGSGSIDIGGVTGNVHVKDGSGSMSIRDVSGDVVVSDGSGSVDVRDVGGDFQMEEDGSGSVSQSGIRGRRLGS